MSKPILRIWDETAQKYVPIPAIIGPKGDKGEKGDKGDKGDTGAKGDKGGKGETGATGHSPVKGTDYWTDTDKAELVQDAITQLMPEVWTFTLADGSTVTKNVAVKG